ncbi:homeodomain-interacting protein kinase 1-like [Mastacembelus armatus]|uniref:homeodomain-interacting protein kinase 1-like n=1 Tax=Mastacembelus armatus TaxID=205130 RepID=UPI000E459549|nr:homeodomain-interacting protein kinase 1-like [Mastacembelus armatus]
MSSTSADKYEQLVIGSLLTSKSSTYQVQSLLGRGTFGTVAKCVRMKDMKLVAIKLMKNEGIYIHQAKEEVAALLKLTSLDKSNLVHWHHAFTDKGHICLVFEHLDKSLFDFMKERYFQPLLLKEIRPIVQQVASALSHLKAARIIHADLKLENVMLVNHLQEPYRVKVIDFGLACEVSDVRPGACIQTRPYRAPEILLGLPFTEAVDMWSLGCMAVSMYLGTVLYPGRSDYDVVRAIEPQNFADKAAEIHDVVIFVDLLKAMLELDAANRITPHQVLEHHFTSLFHMVSLYPLSHHVRSCHEIMSICWNKTPIPVSAEAACGSLEQSHCINPHPCASTHTTSSDESGRKRKVDDEDKNETSHLSLHHSISTHASKSCQTQSRVRSGGKRKVVDAEDVECKESDSDHSQRSENGGKRLRKSSAGPSTSRNPRSHRQTLSHTSTRVKRKRVHAEDSVMCEESDQEQKRTRKCCAGSSTCSSSSSTHSGHTLHIRPEHSSSPAEHHYLNAHPSSCNQTEIQPRAGMKRKAVDDDVRPRKRSSTIDHMGTERGDEEENKRHKGPYVNEDGQAVPLTGSPGPGLNLV